MNCVPNSITVVRPIPLESISTSEPPLNLFRKSTHIHTSQLTRMASADNNASYNTSLLALHYRRISYFVYRTLPKALRARNRSDNRKGFESRYAFAKGVESLGVVEMAPRN